MTASQECLTKYGNRYIIVDIVYPVVLNFRVRGIENVFLEVYWIHLVGCIVDKQWKKPSFDVIYDIHHHFDYLLLDQKICCPGINAFGDSYFFHIRFFMWGERQTLSPLLILKMIRNNLPWVQLNDPFVGILPTLFKESIITVRSRFDPFEVVR